MEGEKVFTLNPLAFALVGATNEIARRRGLSPTCDEVWCPVETTLRQRPELISEWNAWLVLNDERPGSPAAEREIANMVEAAIAKDSA